MADESATDAKGQNLNEVKSELAEIIILQRDAAHAKTEMEAVQAYDVIIGKLLTHIKSRVKRTETKDDDEMLGDILFKYKDAKLETIKTKPGNYTYEPMLIIWIGNDTSTEVAIHAQFAQSMIAAMKEQAYARLKEKKIAMYNELMEIIADEFDLNRDLTKNTIAQDDFERRYFDDKK